MKTASINQIEKLKDDIAKNLEIYRNKLKKDSTDVTKRGYGNEQEYCINDLIISVRNILKNLSYLIKSHNVFIQCSTYSERTNLQSYLSNLNQYIQNMNHSNIAGSIEQLKAIIRCFHLFFEKKAIVDLKNEMDNLLRTNVSLEDDITNTNARLTESNVLLNEIENQKTIFDGKLEELEGNKNELQTIVDDFICKFNEFKDLTENATKNENIIRTKLEDIQEKETIFDKFIKKIEVRETQLAKQSLTTNNYEQTLATYSERQGILEETAQNLIKNALLALNYSNATGLSAAFSAQHDIANNKHRKIWWLFGAGIFIILTMFLGIWVITGWGIDPNIQNPILSIVGRLTMIPFTLLAAIFCANQYIKQKNLIEDYAYKTVLAKSMIAFSEELRDKEPQKYAEYLSTVLKEIHQDPLRKRGKENDDVTAKGMAGILNKVIDLFSESNISK